MPKIVTLKDNNDDTVYPITPIDAVFTDTSVTLENMIDAKADTDLTNVINGSVTASKIANSAVTSDKIDWATHTVTFESGYSGSVVLKSLGKMRFLSGQINASGGFPNNSYAKAASLPNELNGSIVGAQATGVGRSGGDTLSTVTITEGTDRKIEIRAVSGNPGWTRFSLFWFVQ